LAATMFDQYSRLFNVKIALVSCLLAAIVIAGCTVGPDYHAPVTSVPDGWLNTGQAPTTQAITTHRAGTLRRTVAFPEPVKLVRWWKTFNDPELNSLIVRAIAANLDLKEAQSRLRQARYARIIAVAGLLPQVNANGGFTRNHTGGHPSNTS